MTKKTEKKVIELNTIAKVFSDPQMFKDDLVELAAKMRAFALKYGGLGIKALMETLRQL